MLSAEELKAYEGQAAVRAAPGKDPVNAPMIRHWCEALGDTNPAYAAPDPIAPPTMLQAWTMTGLTGDAPRTPAYESLLARLDEAGCTAVVATDCEQEYDVPLRPGDEITYDTVVESVTGPKSTKLGRGWFITTRTTIRTADGTRAGTHRFRILKYAPSGTEAEPRPESEPKPESGARPEPRSTEAGPEPRRLRPTEAAPQPRRPRPVVNRDNSPYWDAIRSHRLLIQHCTACGTLRLPWHPGCAACGSPEWDTREASGEGTVHSYVVMHHPPFPAFDPPYAVVLVELAEGVRLVSNIVGVPYDKVRIGMPVSLEFRAYDEELTLPVFRAAAAAEGVSDA